MGLKSRFTVSAATGRIGAPGCARESRMNEINKFPGFGRKLRDTTGMEGRSGAGCGAEGRIGNSSLHGTPLIHPERAVMSTSD